MERVFLRVLNMSFTGGVLILAVVLLRLLLRKAPKWSRCILWALVAVRLACPFSISSSLSAFQLMNSSADEKGNVEYLKYVENGSEHRRVRYVLDSEVIPLDTEEPPADSLIRPVRAARMTALEFLASWRLWLAGLGAMLIYAVVSYWLLWRRVRASIPVETGLWLCDNIDSPFILGLFRPRIYLPSGLSDGQMERVLAHETAHLKRRDHWWKPLGFLLLAVHWFNPLVWLAFVLLCRDIELACDEKVIRDLSLDARADYSQTILDCSVRRRLVSVCPLAFGEVGVKARVKAVLSYQKPAIWIIAASLILCAAVGLCFLTNPRQETEDSPLRTREDLIEYVRDNCDLDGVDIADWLPVEGQFSDGEFDQSFEVKSEQGERYMLYVHGTYFTYADGIPPSREMTVTEARLEPLAPEETDRTQNSDSSVSAWSDRLGAAGILGAECTSAEGSFPLTETQIGTLTILLDAVPAEEIRSGRGGPYQRSVTVRTEKGALMLGLVGEIVALSLEGDLAEELPLPRNDPSPCWEINNAALHCFMEELTEESSARLTFATEPLLTVTFGGETVSPYIAMRWSETWTEQGWLTADGEPIEQIIRDHGKEIPWLSYDGARWKEIRLGEGVSFASPTLRIYSDGLELLSSSETWDSSAISALVPGSYWCVITVEKDGSYIASEGRAESHGYSCVFRLSVAKV